MIDFTNLPHTNKSYGGANGEKLPVIYNGELYMVKFPPAPTQKTELNYL